MKTSSIAKAFTLIIVIAACEQTSDPFENPLKGYLTSDTWKTASLTFSPGFANVCEYDNTFSFSTGGNLTIDQGVLKCKSTDPSVFISTWKANKDYTQLTVDNWGWGVLPNVWKVTRLTKDNFDFTVDFNNNGIATKVTYKLEKGDVVQPQPFAQIINEGAYTIRIKSDQSYIDINSTSNNIRTSSNPRIWKLVKTPDGNFFIRPDGLNDNVDQNVGNEEAILWAGHEGDNQQWKIVTTTDGYFRIQNKINAKVITSTGASTNLVCKPTSNTDQQLFRFYPASSNRFEGSGYKSNTVQFGGGACTFSIQMQWISFKFDLNGSTISNASLTNGTEEKTVIGSCPPQGYLNQSYIYSNGSVQGSTITINFTPSSQNFTKCNVQFIGTITSNVIKGNLKWTRTDFGGSLGYEVNYPITLVK